MLELYDGDYLEQDLANIPDGDLVDAFLTQLAESEDALWQLTKWPGEHHNPFFNCKGVQTLQQQGYNIYRVRPLSTGLSQYRVLYAYDARYDQLHNLAVVRKRPLVLPPNALPNEFYDYEPTHPVTRRICDEYDTLRIDRVR